MARKANKSYGMASVQRPDGSNEFVFTMGPTNAAVAKTLKNAGPINAARIDTLQTPPFLNNDNPKRARKRWFGWFD